MTPKPDMASFQSQANQPGRQTLQRLHDILKKTKASTLSSRVHRPQRREAEHEREWHIDFPPKLVIFGNPSRDALMNAVARHRDRLRSRD